MAKIEILLVFTLIAVVEMSEMDEQYERGSIYDYERPDTREDFTNVDLTNEPSIENYRLVKRSSDSRCVQCCSSKNGGLSPHYRGAFWEVDSRSLSRGNPLGATQIASAVNEGSSRGGWKATQIASARNDGSVRNGPWKSDQGGYYDGLSNRNQWKSNKFPSAVNQGGVVSGPWGSRRGQKLNQISSAVSDGSVRNGPFISVGGGGYRLDDGTYQKPRKGGGGGAPRGSLKMSKFPKPASNGPWKHHQVSSSGLGPGWMENSDQICRLFSQRKGDRMVVEIEDQDGSGKDITLDCNIVDSDEDPLEFTMDNKKRDVASQAGTNDQATAREGDRQKSRSFGSFGPNDKNTGVVNKIRITIKPNLKSNNQNSIKTKVTKIM